MDARSLQSCLILCNPVGYNLPGSCVHGIFREEYWSRLPCPPSGESSHSGIKRTSLMSFVRSGRVFTTTTYLWSPLNGVGAFNSFRISSVQFSYSVVSDSLWPHGMQHARLPCPSPTSRTYSNSCPLSQWCHPTISSPVIPFSSHLQSFPAPGSFQMSQFFASSGQSIGVSASASVLPKNIQDWFL